MGLTRFRADPSKVRVSVRRVLNGWSVQVSSRVSSSPLYTVADRADASSALDAALDAADQLNIPGIDIGMDRAYEHPFQ